MIGAQVEAIRKGEDRQLFKECMAKIGLECARSATAHTMEEAHARHDQDRDVGLPSLSAPAFTLGGTGGGIAYNREEFEKFAASGLDAVPHIGNSGRGIPPRLERVRNGGDARSRR